MELYDETVADLLVFGNNRNRKIREKDGKVFVKNPSTERVVDWSTVQTVMEKGEANRRTFR